MVPNLNRLPLRRWKRGLFPIRSDSPARQDVAFGSCGRGGFSPPLPLPKSEISADKSFWGAGAFFKKPLQETISSSCLDSPAQRFGPNEAGPKRAKTEQDVAFGLRGREGLLLPPFAEIGDFGCQKFLEVLEPSFKKVPSGGVRGGRAPSTHPGCRGGAPASLLSVAIGMGHDVSLGDGVIVIA